MAKVSQPRNADAAQLPLFIEEDPSGGGRTGSKWLKRGLKALLIVAVVGALALAGTMLWALYIQPINLAADRLSQPSMILEAADGSPLARKGPFQLPDAEREDFPDHLVNAVITMEDRRFYKHWGIDPRGIVRALHRNIEAGKIVEGGSTITQQLVKIVLQNPDRTLIRKLREAFLAIWLEMHLDKDAILTRYLNNVYLGAGTRGMRAAARAYFGKSTSELTLSEAALLAGLIKAPSQLSPLRDIEAARERAALVLDAMVANGMIEKETAEKAKAQPAKLSPSQLKAHAGSWFADWVAQEAAEISDSFTANTRIRTTLVRPLQDLAEQVVENALADVGSEAGASQAALVALRPDGAVVAMVGGRSYQESEFNRAVQAQRQPGSAFKLFVYFAALRAGFSLEDRVQDAPLDVAGWQPDNFNEEYHGSVTLAEAFAKSMNTASARLALEVGMDQVVSAARDLGIDATLHEQPSLALGTSEVSLLDLTAAYASVRVGRMPLEPWGIAALGAEAPAQLFALGPPVARQQSLGPYQAPLTTLLELTVQHGTGRAAALDGFAAGKTGTSQNYRDAWFIGFNKSLVVGVWVGNDDGTPMNKVTGGTLPARIWKDFMTKAAMVAGSEERPPDYSPGEAMADAAYGEVVEPQCDYEACAAAYRSFRGSDCTYQPYSGPRRFCDRGLSADSPPENQDLLSDRAFPQPEPASSQPPAGLPQALSNPPSGDQSLSPLVIPPPEALPNLPPPGVFLGRRPSGTVRLPHADPAGSDR